ncbi:MAG TPA: hypothetical protein VD908_05020 [Cytophagales bacterium]|nr:hypothetical protein [Cytophagales bacterium]
MENDQVIDSDLTSERKFKLSEKTFELLMSISKWTRFLSIAGFVWVTFCFLFGFSFGAGFDLFNTYTQTTSFSAIFLALLYFIIGLLMFFPVLYLYRFSIYIRKGLKEDEDANIVNALINLSAHYKYIGILTLVVLFLYAFSIVSLIIGLNV